MHKSKIITYMPQWRRGGWDQRKNFDVQTYDRHIFHALVWSQAYWSQHTLLNACSCILCYVFFKWNNVFPSAIFLPENVNYLQSSFRSLKKCCTFKIPTEHPNTILCSAGSSSTHFVSNWHRFYILFFTEVLFIVANQSASRMLICHGTNFSCLLCEQEMKKSFLQL